MREHQFVVYDERARPPADNDDAAVLSCSPTLKQAREDVTESGVVGVIYRYDVAPPEKPGAPERLINETFIEVREP